MFARMPPPTVECLLERRSVFGLSYYAILGDFDLLEIAAPIVARLAGR